MILDLLDLNNTRIGVIKDAYDVSIEHELSSWDVLKFCIPISSTSWSKIKEELRIGYDGKYFVIKGTGAKMDSKGTRHEEVKCPCIGSDLNSKFNQVLDITGLPEVLMDAILAGSGWTRGVVSISGGLSRTIQSEWLSVVSNLKDAAEKFNAYLFFNSATKTVDLIEDPGNDNGVTIQVGKNILDIDRQKESEELVTRLYAYGSDDMTFNNVNVGITIDDTLRNSLKAKGYIDTQIDAQVCGINQSFIQDFRYFIGLGYTEETIYTDILEVGEASVFIKTGHISEPDYINEQVFLDYCKKELLEICVPKFTYKFSILDLAKLSGYSFESFSQADWIYVYDIDFNIDIRARISNMTEFPGFPEKTTIEISNAKNNLSDVLTSTIKLGNILGDSPRISSLVKGIINTFATTINSADGNLMWEGGVLQAIDNVNPDKRVRLTSGGIGVSIDGGQTYENAITAEGVLANKIIVTEDINLFSGDKRTKLTGSGIEVYDASPQPVKRIHIGNYSSGKYGIWVNAGSLEIVGSLPSSNIPDISANKIVGGTLGATQDIWVGHDANIKINGLLNKILVYDSAEEPNERLVLGAINGDYGLEIYDSTGKTMFSSVSNSLFIGSGGSLVIGSSDTNFKLKFDGTDLIFGSGAIKWANLDLLSQQNLVGPPGEPGPPGADGDPGSDANVPSWVTDWNSGTTVVTSGYICTPKLFIGSGGQIATGIKTESTGLISYKNNIKSGFSLTSVGSLELYDNGGLKAQFDYDTTGDGTPEEAANRAFLRTSSGVALKIESGGEMSIQALTGKIHITSAIKFYGSVDLALATVTGLKARLS